MTLRLHEGATTVYSMAVALKRLPSLAYGNESTREGVACIGEKQSVRGKQVPGSRQQLHFAAFEYVDYW